MYEKQVKSTPIIHQEEFAKKVLDEIFDKFTLAESVEILHYIRKELISAIESHISNNKLSIDVAQENIAILESALASI